MSIAHPGANLGNNGTSLEAIASLSHREAVLEKVATGQTNREIAAELSISIHAVKFHLTSIYRKLGVTNRTEAVVALLKSEAA